MLDSTVAADNLFTLIDTSPTSTTLFLTHLLDREARPSYSFTISAVDRGQPSLTGVTQVTVNVVVS